MALTDTSTSPASGRDSWAICASCSHPFDKFVPGFMQTVPGDIQVFLTCVNYDTLQRYPNLSTVRTNQKTFSRGQALNRAIKANTRPVTIIADVDFLFPSEYWSAVAENAHRLAASFFSAYICRLTPQLNAKSVYHVPVYFKNLMSCHNPFVCRTEKLLAVAGYDERMVGWGAEDDDLNSRLCRSGLTNYRLPIMVFHKDHSEITLQDYREHRHKNKNIWMQNNAGRIVKANG